MNRLNALTPLRIIVGIVVFFAVLTMLVLILAVAVGGGSGHN